MNENFELNQKISKLKNEKNAIILAHNYQIEAVQLAADFIGDSLDLSRKAVGLSQAMIVFAGVKFMAETAKILAPEKKVLLPRLDAGCPMADMITVDELREMKDSHPGAMVVTYVNSSVEIKAESDVCCTSANAIRVVENLPAKEIIFIPDQNLGSYVQKFVPAKKVILFEGFCYVHHRIKKEEITAMRVRYPHAKVIVHPEVRPEVIAGADEVLSTSGMLNYVKKSPLKEFIIATEQGLLQRMKRENPGKYFFPALSQKICSNMKRTALKDIYDSLLEEKYEIEIDPAISEKAGRALQEMLKYD
ncbi:MAG: quinolinate synthase NadA [Acidobacteria bacterium]|nr:quinolinate synthase NadA [Acidobacteriota bacterium]MBU4307076.1 quinolinate synthase NadA [Acidobacteriota bacterium]MCG2811787.1 quinolinate synthase NadA [Candidatus Aminicenantes bacterium]